MVNKEHSLTVDDLIVEYMMCKVKNGYEPSFLTSEFISFLYFFESKMSVEDILYENVKLFKRFFERKGESDWSRLVKFSNNKKDVVPHMDMIYSEEDNDYIIKANYLLGEYDRSIINTYFMDNGLGKYNDYKGKTYEIRKIIEEYLSSSSKRKISDDVDVSNKDLIVGQEVTTEIILNIWDSYIKKLIANNEWPRQCRDINKYLFDVDLAKIIEVQSIKEQLIELYKVFSKRIAILYSEDKNLRISSNSNGYLARANYDLLIQGYEKLMATTFGEYNKSLDIDLGALTFKESHEVDGTYNFDEDPEIKTTTNKIGNNDIKKLVRRFNNIEK